MICAFWKSGDQAEALPELLDEFESEFAVSRTAAGYDGYDIGVFDGTHVWVNNPSPELQRFFTQRRWETWR